MDRISTPTLVCPRCQRPFTEAPNFCPGCGEDLRGLTPTSDTLSGPWSGKVIDGRYRLLEKLGEGGMGAVYKVEHVRMGKILALKLLRPDVALDRKHKSRFIQEARVVSKLSHPNTIQVFDFGELDDGALYIAMEYVQGRDLAWMLRTHGPISEEKAIQVGIQVLASLSEAHEMGIVHRDIKPANVMLVKRKSGDELVKVLDFGIAKLLDVEGKKHITGFDFVGTPAYMSPEQARGDAIDARGDLYSVGAMLFELVTGRSVFTGPTPMSIVTKHLSEPPPRMNEVAPGRLVSPGFEQIIRKALAKNPDERYRDADQMQAALEKLRRELGALATDLTPIPDDATLRMASREDFDRFERRLKLKRTLMPLVVVGLLAGVAGVTVQLYQRAQAGVPLTVEKEPNDDIRHANPLTPGVPLRGELSADRADRDVFVLDAPQRPFSISVRDANDLNLSLDLSTAPADGTTAERLLFVDDVGVGQEERVDGLHLPGKRLFVRVQEPGAAEAEAKRIDVQYTLEVAVIGEPGPLEVEPNDEPERAPQLPKDAAITAFTGSPLPWPAPDVRDRAGAPYLSSVDWLWAAAAGDRPKAVVVPPPKGGLLVLNGAVANEAGQSPVAVRGGLKLVELTPSANGMVGLRVQPEPLTPPGARYYVAFVGDGERGLDAAVDLAKRLLAQGRKEDLAQLEEQLRRAYPKSPQLSAVRSP